MKRTILAVMLAATMTGILAAADAKNAAADAIAAVDKGWAEAYVSCNAKAWDALLADDLVFIHNNGSADDKAKQMASIAQCPLESLTSAVTKVRLYGADTAVVLGNMQGATKGGAYTFNLVYTRVYVRQKGTWRLVSHQSTDAPKKTT